MRLVPDYGQLIVTIGFTDGGVAQSFSGAAIVGNTTTTFQSGTLVIRIDSATRRRSSQRNATGVYADKPGQHDACPKPG